MNLYIFDVQKSEEKFIETNFTKINNVKYFKDSLNLENAKKFQDAEIASIFITSIITKEILDSLPKLKYITTRSTGFDHIDLNAAKECKILVSNVPSYGEQTVAEYTFGLLLCLSRKIIEANKKAKQFDFSCADLIGFDLYGKTLGVIGVGNIGKHVIKIANGFTMNVIAYDKKIDSELEKTLNFKYLNSLEEVLRNSDIITLHVPYFKSTHHLINKNNIKQIKSGAYIINTARGPIIETEALIEALDSKILAGAALDVFESEHEMVEEKAIIKGECGYQALNLLAINHILFKKENVIVSPHNAFNTQEAINRILKTTLDNILAFINNKFINLVN